ncbi:MAG: phosphoglucomutase/phosphomannomutase family protein [Chloroflexi bacterium]|nr:phosphoglucomutase/phosphomannomutase family protein [Chloroflexota bacterium]
MSYRIKFGTDGWRGRIAEDFTFDNVRRMTQGVAQHLKAAKMATRGLVIGYDTRFASPDFALAAAEVLAGNGITAYLVDKPTPTPVISYSILDKKAAGAIIITASHNPSTDNGFKLRSEYGGASPPEILAKIEKYTARATRPKTMPQEVAEKKGLLHIFDPDPAYIAHLPDLVDLEKLQEAGLQILCDSMWGTGAGWFKRLLEGEKTKILEIHAEPNPLFPEMERPEPIPPNLDALQREVLRTRARVGLATDGDADRVGMVDENGHFVTQLQVYALLALYLLEVREWRGPIVKTNSTTAMLYKLGEMYGVPVYETGVGFKYVAPKMLETGAMIGGEESGGFAFRDHIPERDGILAGLFILDLMVHTGKRPSQLVDWLYAKVGPHYYDRRDTVFPPQERQKLAVRLKSQKPARLAGLKVEAMNTLDGFKYLLEGGAWLLIRFSGTEPKIRVYAEAPTPEKVQELLNSGLHLVGLK